MEKILWGIVVVVIIGIFVVAGDSSTQTSIQYPRGDTYADTYPYGDGYDDNVDMYDYAYDNWDSVLEYMSGSDTIEACSNSGCYSLDADISNGYVETVYFPNGGYIYPDAEIDSEGHAEGSDSDGNYWEFQIDTGSSLFEDAISEFISDQQDSEEYYPDDNYYPRY